MVFGTISSSQNMNIPIMSYDFYPLFILGFWHLLFSYFCHIFYWSRNRL